MIIGEPTGAPKGLVVTTASKLNDAHMKRVKNSADVNMGNDRGPDHSNIQYSTLVLFNPTCRSHSLSSN